MPNMDKLLTISVAAYNVEKTLDKTLSSLNDPRFLDAIEVFVIDDGSKDRTRDIAQRYQQLAPNTFHYIAKENGGHGSTINCSMELATGRFFRVIDGDDWVDTDNFAMFIERLRQTDADLVTTSYREYREDNKEEKIVRYIKGLKDGKIYTWEDIFGVDGIWLATLTIKTELLKKQKICITEKCYYVDLEFVIWSLYLAKTIQYFDFPVYVYRTNSSTQSTTKANMLKNIAMMETVSCRLVELYCRFCETGVSEKQKKLLFRPVYQLIGSMYRIYLLKDTVRESREGIIAFEKKLKITSEQVFEELSSIVFFKMIRFANYSFIPFARVLYSFWVKRH